MDIVRESSYPHLYANSTFLPLLLMSLTRQKNSPTPSTEFKNEYDYIIVGGGSAGSAVASRLSELPCVSVLLLEAGNPPPLLSDVPGPGRNFVNTEFDWAYKTVPQRHAGFGLVNRQVPWVSGKALGGSSVLNGMIFARGNKENYDNWEAQGAKGWSYKDVLPYFLKMENNQDPEYLANGFHATSGPVTVERPRYDAVIRGPILESAEPLGFKVLDPNGASQTGFYDIQGTIRDGQRCNTAKAYLVPAESRNNLDILASAFAKKVILDGNKATGVIFDFKGESHVVKARKEVILSAGTIKSAQLLMLSGIGPRKHLQDMNIAVVADLPVGENLHDHPTAAMAYELSPLIPSIVDKLLCPRNIEKYIQNRTGPLASTEAISAIVFFNGLTLAPNLGLPNYQLHLAEAASTFFKTQFGYKPEVQQQIFGPYENKSLYVCYSSALQPKSRGTVRLQSANPYDYPLMDPNYFSDQQDIYDVVQGLKTCQRIAASEPMLKIGSEPFKTLCPGCEQFAQDEDQYLECVARHLPISISHYAGTVKMGDPRDSSTVVDPKLRVKGIEGLRVVDASIMPMVPSGNTNVPTIMVGEKAADMIKETITCRPCTPPKILPKTK